MILLDVVTRIWLGLGVPAATQSAPLIAQTSAGSAAAQAASTKQAAAVLANVEKFYANTKQLTATFGQTVTNAFGEPQQSAGKVYLAKPGKMRLDYTDKKTKTTKTSLISNGTDLYVVEKHKLQVIKKKLSADLMPVAVSFLQGKSKLSAEFTAKLDTSGTFGAKDDIVLELTPKQPSAQFKTLHLVLAKDDYRVKQSIITGASGDQNAFKFYKPDFERALDDKLFEFDPKSAKNYRVIDADQKPPTK